MQFIGKEIAETGNLLIAYARSNRDESFVGKTSEPYLMTVDSKSIGQVMYSCGAARGWRIYNGAFRGPIEAPHAYLFYLINNTRTYREYEQLVITSLPEGRAQLHAGDDFHYYRPILSGDVLAVTMTILPTETKVGRHGEMVFYADEWRMYNQNNELVAKLIRRAVALEFGNDGELESPSDIHEAIPSSESVPAWREAGRGVDPFTVGDVVHVTHHGDLTWMSMMAWLAAVDEYSPTHYDPEFAKAHRYGESGSNIVAGPQLASMMVSELEKGLGSKWWIRNYENVQRRAVYPNEALVSFSQVEAIEEDYVVIRLSLTDPAGVVKGTGRATVTKVTNERNQ